MRRPGIYVVHGDINDAPLVSRMLKVCKPTHVLHLAAQAGVRYAVKKPFQYVESNVRGMVNLLEVLKHEKIVKPSLVSLSQL